MEKVWACLFLIFIIAYCQGVVKMKGFGKNSKKEKKNSFKTCAITEKVADW